MAFVGELSNDERLAEMSKDAVDLTQDETSDRETLNSLKGKLVSAFTSKEAQVVVEQMIELSSASKFCLLSPKNVVRLKLMLDVTEGLLDEELTNLLDHLAIQCQSKIINYQRRYRELNQKCNQLFLESQQLQIIKEVAKIQVTKTQKKVEKQRKKVPTAEKRLKAAQDNLIKVNQAVKDAETDHEQAEEKLVKDQERVVVVYNKDSEYTNERDNIEKQLKSVDAMENVGDGSGSGSSSSSSSSTASSSSSSSSSGNKLLKSVKRKVTQAFGDEDDDANSNHQKSKKKKGRKPDSGMSSSGAITVVQQWEQMQKEEKIRKQKARRETEDNLIKQIIARRDSIIAATANNRFADVANRKSGKAATKRRQFWCHKCQLHIDECIHTYIH